MRIAAALPELRATFAASAQAPEALVPWTAWRTFKQFLQREVEDGYDAASVQWGHFPTPDGTGEEAVLYLVRQFSERADPDAEADELLGRVVVELRFRPQVMAAGAAGDLWTLDFPSLAEWASVVEGTGAFQDAMAAQPMATELYFDQDEPDGADE